MDDVVQRWKETPGISGTSMDRIETCLFLELFIAGHTGHVEGRPAERPCGDAYFRSSMEVGVS